MQHTEPQTGLGRCHVRDAEDFERCQHQHQSAGQDAQAVTLQAREPELIDVPHFQQAQRQAQQAAVCLLYTSPSPRDRTRSRMPSSA